MAPFLRRFLLAYCIIDITASSAISAPVTPSLTQTVPVCAQSCLKSFVADNFHVPGCSSSDLCICTSPSVSGFTLGEAALSCLVSNCPKFDVSAADSAYEICDGFPNALPNTHSVLTITHTSVTYVTDDATTSTMRSTSTLHRSSVVSSTASSKSRKPTSSSHTTSSTTMTSTVRATSSSLIASSASSAPFPSSTSIAAMPATSSAVATPVPVLTKPQIAGVTVASAAGASLIFGLCFLLLCWRRRKAQRRHSGSLLKGGKTPGSEETTPDMSTDAMKRFEQMEHEKEVADSRPMLAAAAPPPRRDGDGWSQWEQPTAAAPTPMPRAARSNVSERSPITPGTQKTTSQLLPDKPSYGLFPPPMRPSPESRRASQSLEALGAARNGQSSYSSVQSSPRFPGALDTSQSYMQQAPKTPSPIYPPDVYSQVRGSRPRSVYRPYRQEQDVSTLPSDLPKRTLSRKPLPGSAFTSAKGLEPETTPTREGPSLLKIVPPPIPPAPLFFEDSGVRRQRSGRSRRKKSEPRIETWFSNGTDTSFEDGSDTEPVSALSPVPEIRSTGPNSPFTYPSIPQSASESRSSRIHLPESAARSDASLPRSHSGDDSSPGGRSRNVQPRNSAKWKILVEPGLRGIDTPSPSSRSPQTARSAEAPWHEYPPPMRR